MKACNCLSNFMQNLSASGSLVKIEKFNGVLPSISYFSTKIQTPHFLHFAFSTLRILEC